MVEKTLALLTERLRIHSSLTDGDVEALKGLPMIVRQVARGKYVVREGDRPEACCAIADGFIVRAKSTENSRQILSIHIPGDIPDLQTLFLAKADHDIIAATACTLGFIPHKAVNSLLETNPNVARAFWRVSLVDASIFREWILNVGQRQAPARLAHLLTETFVRLEAVGMTRQGMFSLPLTQEQLGEATGLTSVHVNRALRVLKNEGAIAMKRGECTILDLDILRGIGGFHDGYLHQSVEKTGNGRAPSVLASLN